MNIAGKKTHVWLGCTSRRYVKEPVEALNILFKKVGIEPKIVDNEEICCGSVLYMTGQEMGGNKNRREVESLLRAKRITEMILLCPGCLRTFSEFYVPRRNNPLKKVYHYTEVLVEKQDQLDLKSRGRSRQINVTYHDPCHLGKHLGIYDAPRKLLSCVPKVNLIEMPKSGKESFCCGSGAGLRAYNKELADHSSYLRLQEAISIGADVLVTSCPFCERSFLAARETYDDVKGLKIQNLAVFISQYL